MAQNSEKREHWTIAIDRLVLDQALDEAAAVAHVYSGWNEWLAIFKESQIYQGWSRIIPQARLNILDAFYASIAEFRNRKKRSTTDHLELYVRPSMYL